MWSRDHNKAGRQLINQLRNLDSFYLMNHPQVWTTTKRTVVDLSLVPADMSSASDWSIYPGMLSDHLAVQIKHSHSINSKIRPRRWLTDHANWEHYSQNITDATIDLEWQDMDTNETSITTAILNFASATIPRSSGKSSTIPYWKHNLGIKMAKCTYNAMLKAFRQLNTPDTLKQVQEAYEAYKAYTELCTLVRNNSWNAWITECNNNPNMAEVWRRIKAANGRRQLVSTYPRPQEEANRLCTTFIQRSSSDNLPTDTTKALTGCFPDRINTIKTAINRETETIQLEEIISHLKDTAPDEDIVCYSMIKILPLPTKYLIPNQTYQPVIYGRSTP